MIMLPGAGDELLIKAVRLGQGGFISPCGRQMTTRPRQNGLFTLTAATHLRERG